MGHGVTSYADQGSEGCRTAFSLRQGWPSVNLPVPQGGMDDSLACQGGRADVYSAVLAAESASRFAATTAEEIGGQHCAVRSGVGLTFLKCALMN